MEINIELDFTDNKHTMNNIMSKNQVLSKESYIPQKAVSTLKHIFWSATNKWNNYHHLWTHNFR